MTCFSYFKILNEIIKTLLTISWTCSFPPMPTMKNKFAMPCLKNPFEGYKKLKKININVRINTIKLSSLVNCIIYLIKCNFIILNSGRFRVIEGFQKTDQLLKSFITIQLPIEVIHIYQALGNILHFYFFFSFYNMYFVSSKFSV